MREANLNVSNRTGHGGSLKPLKTLRWDKSGGLEFIRENQLMSHISLVAQSSWFCLTTGNTKGKSYCAAPWEGCLKSLPARCNQWGGLKPLKTLRARLKWACLHTPKNLAKSHHSEGKSYIALHPDGVSKAGCFISKPTNPQLIFDRNEYFL